MEVKRSAVYFAVVTCIALIILCLTLAVNYVVVRAERDSLQEIAVSQTQLIVELRQELAKEWLDFDSLGELQLWVSDWRMWNIESLGTPFSFWDCDNVAGAMQRGALEDDYLMSIALVDGDCTVYGVKVSDLAHHVGNLAVADSTYYYIEPQTGQIVEVIGRD